MLNPSLRVLLADDHAVLRAGLRMLLSIEPDMEVVGEADSGQQAIDRAAALQPDIILLDVTMPDMDGLVTLPRLKAVAPQARVLILTMHQDEAYLRQALQSGAAGYILKKAADTELLSAIRAVARGEAFVDPAMTRTLISAYLDRQEQPVSPASSAGPGFQTPGSLSPREVEVLRLVAQGYTNQQIAEELVISVKTVETHKAHVQEKLGLHTRVELVQYAKEHNLFS